MIGCAMFIGGFMGLITSAQLDQITARVERVSLSRIFAGSGFPNDLIQDKFKHGTLRFTIRNSPRARQPKLLILVNDEVLATHRLGKAARLAPRLNRATAPRRLHHPASVRVNLGACACYLCH